MLSLVFLALAIKLDYNCFQFLLLINNHFFYLIFNLSHFMRFTVRYRYQKASNSLFCLNSEISNFILWYMYEHHKPMRVLKKKEFERIHGKFITFSGTT